MKRTRRERRRAVEAPRGAPAGGTPDHRAVKQKAAEARRDRRTGLLAAAALAAIVALTYGNSLEAGFTLDSRAIILLAPQVQDATWANVLDILGHDYWWPMNVVGIYRPLTSLSYLFNFAVLGDGHLPAGYHWVNLLLCFANALLVQAVARQALGLGRRPAFLLAALFTTHPVGPEAVTNIVGRADLLAATAVLGGLLLHLHATRAHGMRRVLWLVALGATIVLGSFAKENALTLVGVIVVYDLVFALRIPSQGEGGFVRELARLARRNWLALLPPVALVFAVRLAVRLGAPPIAPDYAENAILGLGLVASRLTALKILARSLWVLAWPRTLCPDYSVGEIAPFGSPGAADDWQAAAAVAAVAMAAAVAVVLARRGAPDGRRALFLVGFFAVTWLPTSNLIVPLGSTFGERFLYVPQLAFLGAVVLAVEALGRAAGRLPFALPQARRLAPAIVSYGLLGALAVAYGWRTHLRNRDWRDDLSLWSAAAESCPASFQSHKGFAAALVSSIADPADLERAIAEDETAQAILERFAPPGATVPAIVLENLGAFELRKADRLASLDRTAEAEQSARAAATALERAAAWYDGLNEQLRAAARARGEDPESAFEVGLSTLYENLGRAYLTIDEPGKALGAFRRQRRLAPDVATAYVSAARAERALGRPREALQSVLQALLVDPSREDLAPLLVELYRTALPGGCAIVPQGESYAIDPQCASTRSVVCPAYEDLIAGFLAAPRLPRTQREAAAASLRDAARETFGCDTEGWLRGESPH